jgi:hypothetical protein
MFEFRKASAPAKLIPTGSAGLLLSIGFCGASGGFGATTDVQNLVLYIGIALLWISLICLLVGMFWLAFR